MADWRDEVDPLIKDYLEKLVAESARHRKEYEKAPNKPVAQLWVSNAILQKQVVELSLKLKFLEKAMADIHGKKKEDGEKIDADKAMRDVISRKALKKEEKEESKKEEEQKS